MLYYIITERREAIIVKKGIQNYIDYYNNGQKHQKMLC